MNKYLKQYKWSNIGQMLRNEKLDPYICTERFDGRLVVISGATSGIGYETALKYASMGARILSLNRNEKKSQELCDTLRSRYGAECSYMIGDFSRLADVHELGKKLAKMPDTIDVLIHNAGVFLTAKSMTSDNMETVFQTNYLSTFILNYYLKEKIKKQNSGRIIFVNSEGHRFAVTGLHFDDLDWSRHRYSGLKSYGAAKTAQLLSLIKLYEYYSGTAVTVNAMHPGNVKSNMGNTNGAGYKSIKSFLVDRNAKSAEISAEALYYLGVSPDVKDISGKFFNLTRLEEPAPPALDREAADELWTISHKLGGLEL